MTGAVYEIPVPPSMNHAWRSTKRGGHYIEGSVKKWRTQAAWELTQQKCRPVIGVVEVHLTVRHPKQRSDIDNRIKNVLDLLVTKGVIATDDDTVVRRVIAEWGDVPRARVEIRAVG